MTRKIEIKSRTIALGFQIIIEVVEVVVEEGAVGDVEEDSVSNTKAGIAVEVVAVVGEAVVAGAEVEEAVTLVSSKKTTHSKQSDRNMIIPLRQNVRRLTILSKQKENQDLAHK